MLTILYRLILVWIILLIVLRLSKEEKPWEQLMAAMVLVPLILRLLLIK